MSEQPPVDPANPLSAPRREEIVNMPPPPPKLTAAAALMELKRRVGHIAKEGTNTTPGQNYAFRGVDQVYDTCGPIERELGLLSLPELVHYETAQVEYGAKRGLGFRVIVHCRWHFVGPDGSELIVGPVPGESIDSGDKATAKAMSVALRTTYLQALMIPTGEPDPDASTYVLAQPAAEISDPVVVEKLAERIRNADSETKLQTVYRAIVTEHGGEKATITPDDRDRLVNYVTFCLHIGRRSTEIPQNAIEAAVSFNDTRSPALPETEPAAADDRADNSPGV